MILTKAHLKRLIKEALNEALDTVTPTKRKIISVGDGPTTGPSRGSATPSADKSTVVSARPNIAADMGSKTAVDASVSTANPMVGYRALHKAVEEFKQFPEIHDKYGKVLGALLTRIETLVIGALNEGKKKKK